jgi:hypothetical protein
MKKMLCACAMVLIAASVQAQQKPQQKPQPAKESTKPAADPQAGAMPVNMRLDFTITDDRGNGAPISKTVSITTADRFWGRIRTNGDIATSEGRRVPVTLNVDARPTLVRDNRARVELTIEYRPTAEIMSPVGLAPSTHPDSNAVPPNINESLAVVLDDGKSMVISQSADPITDRKGKVEAKLSILR